MTITGKAFLYVTAFFTGGAILALEVLGTRIIAPFYGTTAFVWTSLIIVTLGALAFGYFFGGYLADKKPNQSVLYSIIFLSGIFFLIPMKIDQWVLPYTDKFGLQYGPLISAFILFFIPLFLLGMVSPFVIRLTTDNIQTSGKNAGYIFAIGTLGSILGGFISGFYLLDKFSITQSLSATAIVLLVVSIVGLIKNKVLFKTLLGIAFILVFINIWSIPSYKHKDNYTLQILHQEQSRYADIKIIEIGGYRCLVMDGSTQSCTDLITGKTPFGSVLEMGSVVSGQIKDNYLNKDKNSEFRVLLLGLGTGDLFKLFPNAEIIIDSVEIDPKVAVVAEKYFPTNNIHKQNVYIDDARHFLTTTNNQYDVIISDLFLGNSLPAYMYSQEALILFRNHLKNDGLMLIHFASTVEDNNPILVSMITTGENVFNKVVPTTVRNYEEDELQNIILHLSQQNDYRYIPKDDSLYAPSDIVPTENNLLTDSRNTLYKYPLSYASDIRNSMINFGGYRMLFSL